MSYYICRCGSRARRGIRCKGCDKFQHEAERDYKEEQVEQLKLFCPACCQQITRSKHLDALGESSHRWAEQAELNSAHMNEVRNALLRLEELVRKGPDQAPVRTRVPEGAHKETL